MKIETVTDHRCALGEGPVWDAKHSEIIWLDIFGCKIHTHNMENQNSHTYNIKEMIGSTALCKDGSLLIACHSGFGLLNRKTGVLSKLTDPEDHLPNNRFNDGKCDPAGRFWAGTMSLSEEKGAGNLYVLHGRVATKKIEKVTISNGMAWSLDHKTMYYIDTPTLEIVAYDYDKTTGEIDNRRVVIRVPVEDGYPDGMTIDADGMLWIAHWGGWQVTRWNPLTGKKISAIALPAAKITSCTFGGKNLTDLFITSAKESLSLSELKSQPLAGALFVIKDCGYSGIPAFEFDNTPYHEASST